MSKKIRNTEVDHLFDAILTLENGKGAIHFEDVCTMTGVAFYFTEDMK